jgi:hypothetical protein
MVTFTYDSSFITVDHRQPDYVEEGMPPEARGRVIRIDADHRFRQRTRIWQFFCFGCMDFWVASCGNGHDNEVPCEHCYDFKERRQKHEDEGWILTCPPCAKRDRGETQPQLDPTVEPKAKTAGGGSWGTKRTRKSTKTTGPIISYKLPKF